MRKSVVVIGLLVCLRCQIAFSSVPRQIGEPGLRLPLAQPRVNEIPSGTAHFYSHLLGKRKLPPAAALRATQLEMVHNQYWPSPSYWAAFTLQGEW